MSWINISDIGRLQIELTNYCNAACPLCLRNDIASKHLNSTNLSFQTLKDRLSKYKWPNLDIVDLCGHVDEPTLHPDFLAIVDYLLALNTRLEVHIATNGGARNTQFWSKLGCLSRDRRVVVVFGIDGLESTNHIYRKNVKWASLQRNYKAFIQNGGFAKWQFIPFEHNHHEIEKAQRVADLEGFKKFKIKSSYNKQSKEIKPYYEETIQFGNVSNKKVICSARPNSGKEIFHSKFGSLFISNEGYCLPCCWMGTPEQINKLIRLSETSLDNINLYKNNFSYILASDTFQFIKDNLQNYELCVQKCKKNSHTNNKVNKISS